MAETAETPAEQLVRLLDLEGDGRDAYVGDTDIGGNRLFGGLVAAQAVVAAGRSVSESPLHSLHAYFLRPGKPGVPIRFAVQRTKEGRVFDVRSVVACQGDEIIFTAQASFARPEEGISHQDAMPPAPEPEALPADEIAPGSRRWSHRPVEMRSCDPDLADAEQPAFRRVWIRPRGPLPDDPLMHAAVLVYASDRRLVSTAARPYRDRHQRRRGGSLDHAVWIHRPVRFSDWLFYTMESPVAHAARALVLGAIYEREGSRVASVAQEGLIRLSP